MTDVGLELPAARSFPLRHKLTAAFLLLLAGAALAYIPLVNWSQNHAPFSPSAMKLQLSLSVVPVSGLQSSISKLGVTPEDLRAMQPMAAGQQAVIGRLDFTIPMAAAPGSQLALFIIDEREHRLVQWAWAWDAGAQPTSGFDGRFAGFASRYKWLVPTASELSRGDTKQGTAISIPFGARAPLVFYAVLDPDAIQVSDVTRDLSVSLGSVGPKGQIYWAQRLTPIGPAL